METKQNIIGFRPLTGMCWSNDCAIAVGTRGGRAVSVP